MSISTCLIHKNYGDAVHYRVRNKLVAVSSDTISDFSTSSLNVEGLIIIRIDCDETCWQLFTRTSSRSREIAAFTWFGLFKRHLV